MIRKKTTTIFTTIIMMALYFNICAADTVYVYTTSPAIGLSSSEEAGSILFDFGEVDWPSITPGCWISIYLPNGVTIATGSAWGTPGAQSLTVYDVNGMSSLNIAGLRINTTNYIYNTVSAIPDSTGELTFTGSYQIAHISGYHIDDDGDGYTENEGDCDDSIVSVYPGATEICGDGIDQDCSGSDLTCPEDIDDDGDGYTENQGDCNDNNNSIYPGATEVCGDGIDQDCSGGDCLPPNQIDDDGDGYTVVQGDCNDGDSTIHPGASEICGDGIDQDCNGSDCVANTCPTLILTVPSSDVTLSPGETFRISWDGTDPDDVARVKLFVDTDTDYSNGTSFDITDNLAEDGSYNWNSSGVAPGSYFIGGLITDFDCYKTDYADGQVTIASADQISVPNPISPAADAIFSTTSITLEWTTGGGTNWPLQVQTHNGTSVFDDTVSESPQNTLSNLSAGEYQWRVAASNSDSSTVSDYTSWQTFTIGSPCSGTTPSQLAPLAGAEIDGASVSIDWSDGDGSQWSLQIEHIDGTSIYDGVVTASSDFTFNGMAEGRYRWRVSSRNSDGSCVSSWTGWSGFAMGNPPIAWQALSGIIQYNGEPVCAMMLANGKYQFTCSGDGSFHLDLPLDDNNEITVQAFCSGLAPYRQVIPHDQSMNVPVDLSRSENDKVLEVYPIVTQHSTGRCLLSGTVEYENSPVCAMVLANGQYMFTCSGDGSFDLDVPLDGNDEVTLYVFCSGFQPYKHIFDDFQPLDDLDGDGYTADEGDCDDSNPSIYPGAEEICGDEIDQDCDGIDLSCPPVDADGDGYSVDVDCNDNEASIYPGAIEICGDEIDQDCDGKDLVCSPTIDADGDGYSVDVDCDDNDSSIYPGAPVIYGDNIDQDCDGKDEIEVAP